MRISTYRAKVKDSVKIIKLEESVWGEKNITTKYEMVASIRFGYSFVAKHKGKIIGAILSIRTYDNKVFVQDWVVDRKYQGCGIGKKLYKRLVKETGNLPIIGYIYKDRKRQIEFYKKIGLKVKTRPVKDPYNTGSKKPRLLVTRYK